MADFPAGLPSPNTSGYTIKPIDQTIRSEMEMGGQRVRRRSTARFDKVSVGWQLTDAQFATFRTWYENAATGAAGGSGWFNISLPVGATGLDTVETRFAGVYQASYMDGFNWYVTAELEVRNA
jgi:hypothetical protein